jgi:hypothetical protein
MYDFEHASAWTRFWHMPVRAERLAITRILFGLALFTDQLFQYLQHFADFFGPYGVGFAGLHDESMLHEWHWSVLFFRTDDLFWVATVFAVWMAVTVAFMVGWQTRFMNILLWLGTMCFHNRNPNLTNFGDQVLSAGLFLLMLSPSGKAFSLDRWLQRRKLKAQGWPTPPGFDPAMTPAWPVRLLQIQICMIYLSTGLAKLARAHPNTGTWWQGTSVWYMLQDCTMVRRAYAEFPIPFWMTVVATYLSVWFETLFPFLVLSRWTRKWTLWFGVLLHLGIWLTIEVGWFSFYTICLYGVWIPGEFWDRWLYRRRAGPLGRGSTGQDGQQVSESDIARIAVEQTAD